MVSRYPAGRDRDERLVAGPVFDGSLLEQVSRVQHDKTLQAVRDMIEKVSTTKPSGYTSTPRKVSEFKDDVLAGLRKLRDEV